MKRNTDHAQRITKIEKDRAPIDRDRDIPTILRSARARSKPPRLTKTLAHLEALVADHRLSPLSRRMARASIVCHLYSGGAEEIAQRIAHYKAHATPVELLRFKNFLAVHSAEGSFLDLC